MMAQKIVTRTSIQIKSHHQKLLKKYKSIEKIIEALEERLSSSTELTESRAELASKT